MCTAVLICVVVWNAEKECFDQKLIFSVEWCINIKIIKIPPLFSKNNNEKYHVLILMKVILINSLKTTFIK